jgi:MoaA/NifB/PqqE/SkfB family radical SAM enzyme
MSFNIENVKVLHLEPTTICNASCPQCGREDDRYFIESRDSSELTLDYVTKNYAPKFIQNLEKVFMCGNFGEPAACKEVLSIYKYFKEHNPKIVLGMNTNGSIRTPSWWQELAGIFDNPYSYVVFSIDGLEDTNQIYRRNTVWSKIIENAQAFIQAGGSAHWDMLVYEHNEHQVDTAKQLAKNLGFSWFRAKVSKRFHTNPVEFLNPPKNYSLPNVTESSSVINCHALNESSVYVAANGKVLPCCWFGAEVFTLDDEAKDLLSDWNNKLVPSWQDQPHRICQSTCSVDPSGTSFSKQWKIEEQLK